MKIILIVLTIFLLNTNMVFASDNFSNPDWWKVATVEDVKREIENGADVNAKSNGGLTALMLAARNNENPEVIKILLKAGADVNVKGKYGGTALISASHNENSEVIKALIENGADVNVKDDEDWTPLMHTWFTKNSEVIKALIDAGADVNAKTETGLMVGATALIILAGNKNPEVIKALIDAGADVNAKIEAGEAINLIGETALIKAARMGNPEGVKLLIEAGADVNAKNDEGNTALDVAQNKKVIEILQKYQNDFNEFDDAFENCYSTQNIGSYPNKFCECAIKSAMNALNDDDKNKAQDAFNDARVGTFKNLIQKGKPTAFNECY